MHQVIGGTFTVNTQNLEGLSKYKADEIEKILMMGSSASSLDAPVNEDGDATLGDTISDVQNQTDELARKHNRADVFNKVMDDNLSDQEKEILFLATLLHDAGMCAISPEISEAPRKLTDEEMQTLRTHVQVVEDILKGMILTKIRFFMLSKNYILLIILQKNIQMHIILFLLI